MEYCEKHLQMATDIAEIKTEIKAIREEQIRHCSQHLTWNTQIIGIVVCIVIQVVTFAFLWGSQSKQVSVNTGRLDSLVALHTKEIK